MSQSSITQQEIRTLQKYFPNGLVALDLETTGLSPLTDHIIEIGAVKIGPTGNQQNLSMLVEPPCLIPKKTIEIHHITDEMVKDEKKIDEALPLFFDFIDDLPLVAHNAKFDLGFIMFNAHKLNLETYDNNVLCSCSYGRRILKDIANHKLTTMCAHYHINLTQHHRAYQDALACLRVFIQTMIDSPRNNEAQNAFQFSLKEFKSLKNVIIPPLLKKIKKEIFNQQPLLLSYQGGSLKMEFRPIRPNSLLATPSGPVLYALCLVTRQFKSFSFKKIKDIKVASDKEITEAVEVGKNKIKESFCETKKIF